MRCSLVRALPLRIFSVVYGRRLRSATRWTSEAHPAVRPCKVILARFVESRANSWQQYPLALARLIDKLKAVQNSSGYQFGLLQTFMQVFRVGYPTKNATLHLHRCDRSFVVPDIRGADAVLQ